MHFYTGLGVDLHKNIASEDLGPVVNGTLVVSGGLIHVPVKSIRPSLVLRRVEGMLKPILAS